MFINLSSLNLACEVVILDYHWLICIYIYVLNVVDNRRYQNIIMLYISVHVVKLLNRATACQVLYLVTLILSGFLKDVELCFYSAKGSFRNSCLYRRHSSPKRNKGTKFRKILKRFYYKLHLRQS